MQIVIDIDENLYTRLFDNGIEIANDDVSAIVTAIRKGTVFENKIASNNLCSSCTNMGCEFQSGIARTECAFYMSSVTPQQTYEEYKDIAKAFQLGLALGFGEKHDEMGKVIDEIKKVITP